MGFFFQPAQCDRPPGAVGEGRGNTYSVSKSLAMLIDFLIIAVFIIEYKKWYGAHKNGQISSGNARAHQLTRQRAPHNFTLKFYTQRTSFSKETQLEN